MNDERPIEKLLRRAAQKRSDESGAPPELHPANRRLLLDEVARQTPKPAPSQPASAPAWWTMLKARWAYGVGVFAVLWVAAIAIVPLFSKPKPKAELALISPAATKENISFDFAKDAAAAPEPLATPMPTATTAAMETDAAGVINSARSEPARALAPQLATRQVASSLPSTGTKREVGSSRATRDSATPFTNALIVANAGASRLTADQTTRLSSPASERSAKIAPLPEANQLAFSDDKQRGNFAAATPPATVSTVSAVSDLAVAPAETRADGYAVEKNFIARGGGLDREQVSRASQRYANASPLAPKKEARSYGLPVTVLQNFRVEQAGRDLRIVDGDGSVYTGVVDEDNTRYKQMVQRQNSARSNAYESKFKFQAPKTAAPSAGGKIAGEIFYSYRVEGTNRTLNQNVVFTWNFVDTNTLAAENLNYRAPAQKLDALVPPATFPMLLQNSYISGRAQLGVSREVEVNALPVKP